MGYSFVNRKNKKIPRRAGGGIYCKRRGQVEGMESSRSGARIVKAMVPLAEMFGYVTALRTITSGRATSSMTYSHHAQLSSSIAKAVLEEVKGRADLL